jgi:UDP:flavonoid glycosyltransferase YjiC (YdhE family)
MKIIIACMPATGHLNPLLAITRILLAEGHEINFLTGSVFRARIESSGANSFRFRAPQTSMGGIFSRWFPN